MKEVSSKLSEQIYDNWEKGAVLFRRCIGQPTQLEGELRRVWNTVTGMVENEFAVAVYRVDLDLDGEKVSLQIELLEDNPSIYAGTIEEFASESVYGSDEALMRAYIDAVFLEPANAHIPHPHFAETNGWWNIACDNEQKLSDFLRMKKIKKS